MRLLGFYQDEESKAVLDELTQAESHYDVTSVRKACVPLTHSILYSLPGLPLCWKCTVKHLGQAVGFAAEVGDYPERIICVVGELGHAYRECPSKPVAEKIRNVYKSILDTGCVPDLTELMKAVRSGWLSNVIDTPPSNPQ